MAAKNLSVRYGEKTALDDVSLEIKSPGVTALIGPSGCGKSTFLRCLNRMNDTIPGAVVSGSVELDGQEIYAPGVDAVTVRRRVGMVFQKPNPFPKSIYENVAFGIRLHGLASGHSGVYRKVSESLNRAGLMAEVKNRLKQPATSLSGGQQQRLCIARAIAISPEVLLMDEPCSALDPASTEAVEKLIKELAQSMAVVIVTHNLGQAKRLANWAAYFHLGKCLEYGPAEALFERPQNAITRDYLKGRFG